MSFLAISLAVLSSIIIEFESDGSRFHELPDSLWIAPGSLVAIADGDTLKAFPGVSGSRTGIVFDPPPPAGSTVTAEFDTLPLRVPSRAFLDVGFAERLQVEQLPSFGMDPLQEHGLYISGSKKIGFSVGDGGGLDQGTRISVDGAAAPGITVSGSVTDRSLASGPYSSELVSQLDRVFFLVDGGVWNVRLGDMEWLSGDGEAGPFSWRREVSGIAAEGGASGEGFDASAGYGTSGDARRKKVFYTMEGVQGPYEVSTGWEIVPGSERVWLDGEQMRRGSTEDYQMEYAAGLLTFTSGRLIRNGQRVEVTFFQRGDGFRKDYMTVSGGYGGDGLAVELKGFHGEDDRDAPLGFLLTEEAVQMLSLAGEDPAEAWVDGAVQVGEGNGSYSRHLEGYFVYEGPGGGDWNVSFGRPPDGPGDYIYDSSVGGYVWVGEGGGTHLPRKYVQIPSGYRMGGVSTGFSSGAISMDLDAAFSRRTGNLFNPDETTREGTLVSGTAVLELLEGGQGVGAGGRLVTAGYRPPGELEADSSLRAWALPPGHSGTDNIARVFAGGEGLLVSAAGRFMESGGRIERYRAAADPVVAGVGASARASFLRRNSTPSFAEGETSSFSLSGMPVEGTLKPFAGAGVFRESWSDSISGSVRTGHAGVLLAAGGSEAMLRLERERDERTGGYTPGPFGVWRARLEGSGPTGTLSCRGSYEYSHTTYDMGGELRADAVRITLTGTAGSVWTQTVYSGSGTVSRSLDVMYVYVGEGEGNFGYDPETGQYYPDPEGDYIVSYQPGGEGEIVTSASLETSVSYSEVFSGLSSVARVSASSSASRSEALLLYGAFDSEREGGYSIDVSPWFRWREGLLSRLTFTGRLRNERISYSGAGLKDTRMWSLRAAPELSLSPVLVIECAARLWREEEELYTPRDTRGIRLSVDPVLEVSPGVRPGILTAWEFRREVISELSEYMLEAGPHFSWTGRGWMANAGVTASYIPGDGSLPAWFFDGGDRGVSWRTSGRIGRNLSSGLDLSLFYWGRRPAGRSWSQRAGLEGTVNF